MFAVRIYMFPIVADWRRVSYIEEAFCSSPMLLWRDSYGVFPEHPFPRPKVRLEEVAGHKPTSYEDESNLGTEGGPCCFLVAQNCFLGDCCPSLLSERRVVDHNYPLEVIFSFEVKTIESLHIQLYVSKIDDADTIASCVSAQHLILDPLPQLWQRHGLWSLSRAQSNLHTGSRTLYSAKTLPIYELVT